MKILKLLTNPLQLPNIPLPVSEVQEVLVPLVGALYASKMLDGAPILFRSGGNLRHVVQDAVGIRTVLAVDLLDQVEIGKMVAVKDQIVGSPNQGNPVEGKANPLVGRADKVQQGNWEQTRVDDRRSYKNEEPRAK